MAPTDFARLALNLPGAEQGSHMGADDFRVGGRIFATLAAVAKGYGNVMLSPEQQGEFVRELPDVFFPVAGKWGEGGVTHIRLAAASEDIVRGALVAAWKRRVALNAATKPLKTKTKTLAARRQGSGQRR